MQAPQLQQERARSPAGGRLGLLSVAALHSARACGALANCVCLRCLPVLATCLLLVNQV